MPYLWLRPIVECTLRGDDLVLWSPIRAVTISDVGRAALDFVMQLDGRKEAKELEAAPLGALLLPLLQKQQWLITLRHPISKLVNHSPWLSRQLAFFAELTQRYPDAAFQELEAKHVIIVGMGGVGGHVAYILGGLGVCLTLIDPDAVEITNLNRQFLFSRDDIGKAKASQVVQSLFQRFPSARATAIDAPLKREHLSCEPKADLLVLCGGSRLPFSEPELFIDLPVLPAGYVGSVATVGPLFSRATGCCWACHVLTKNALESVELPYEGVPRSTRWNTSGSTINALVGSVTGETAIRYLAPSLGGIPFGEEFRFNLKSWTSYTNMRDRVRCPHQLDARSDTGSVL